VGELNTSIMQSQGWGNREAYQKARQRQPCRSNCISNCDITGSGMKGAMKPINRL